MENKTPPHLKKPNLPVTSLPVQALNYKPVCLEGRRQFDA